MAANANRSRASVRTTHPIPPLICLLGRRGAVLARRTAGSVTFALRTASSMASMCGYAGAKVSPARWMAHEIVGTLRCNSGQRHTVGLTGTQVVVTEALAGGGGGGREGH